MTTIICQHCQAKNEAGTELCVACGEPLPVDKFPSENEPGRGTKDEEDVEQWVGQLPKSGALDAESLTQDDESLPGWLADVRAHADKLTEEQADELLSVLAEIEPADDVVDSEPIAEEAHAQAETTSELPDWVAALVPEENWPETEADEALAQHFAEVEEQDEESLSSTAPLPKTGPLPDTSELEGIPQRLAAEDLPEWLIDQEQEEEQPEVEEPPVWPNRNQRLRAPIPGVSGPERTETEPAQESKPEAERGVESLDLVFSELDKTGPDAAAEPTGAADDLSGFEDWMDPAQTAALEETLEEMLDVPEAETSEGRVDQWLDILEGLSGETDDAQLDQVVDESDLEASEIPDWMQSLETDRAVDESELVDDLGPPEESGPLAGLRGVVPAATISLSGSVDRSSVKLEMSKEQRQQAALLRRLTAAEPEALSAAESPDRDTFLTWRLVLGLALLLVVVLGLLVPDVAGLLPEAGDQTLPSAAGLAQEAILASAGRTALVAFDYTPSMSGELDPVADALMADLAANDIAVLAVSQIAAGVPMATRATAETEGLNAISIGFLPGEAAALRALSACLDKNCESLAGRQLRAETSDALADVSLIVVLTADRDSLAGWIEQVGTQNEVPIVGGVTQAMGPVARPYLASDQLAGLVEGLPVAVAYGAITQEGAVADAGQSAAFTLAQWLAIVALLAGLIYFGFVAPAASAVNQVAKK